MLDRRCPDCGFDASTCRPGDVAGLVRENAGVWQGLVTDGTVRPGRPDETTWSSLEYACHVRDVYRRYDARISLMLDQDEPLFPNWDQDASVVEDRYEDQDPSRVAQELRDAAEAIAQRLDGVSDQQWQRRGRRSDGAAFTIASISQYMVHDPIHHIWDVTGREAGPRPPSN